MARAQYADVIIDPTGTPIAGAQIQVYNVDSNGNQTGAATIYTSETGGSSANPFLTNSEGFFSFWATTQARYNIAITASGLAPRVIRWDNDYIAQGQVGSNELSAALALIPVGFGPIPWLFPQAPNGFIFTQGQQVNRSAYPDLNALAASNLYASPFGPGNGSTTFTIPDMRGCYIAGRDNLGGTTARGRITRAEALTMGSNTGSEYVALGLAQMPYHNHNIVADSTVLDYGHSHPTVLVGGPTNAPGPGSYSGIYAGSTGTATSGVNVRTTVTIDPAGGNAAHENLPPTIFVDFVIKAS